MYDILMVEDEKDLAGLLQIYMEKAGYTVKRASSGEEALACLEKEAARMLLLDITLPGIDGFTVCSHVRKTAGIPILMISARAGKEDQLNGFRLGADDYIEKPYDIDIMLAKIKGIFKRQYSMDDITDGNLRLNKVNRTAYKENQPLELTAKEFDLLLLLIENKGKVLKKEFIFRQIWGSDSFSEPQTLTVHIKWLRQKIEENPKSPKRLLTVWGVGYQFL